MAKPPTDPGVAARFKSARAAAQARALRIQPTRAENLLWRDLKQRQPQGSHWRRQAPIGPYIVDFVCHARRLIIELDGGVHRLRADDDAARQSWLEGRGYRVLRFRNATVEADPSTVLRTIAAALADTTD